MIRSMLVAAALLRYADTGSLPDAVPLRRSRVPERAAKYRVITA